MVTYTARLPKCERVCSRVLCVYLGGLSSIITIPMIVYLAYVAVQLTFDFNVQLFRASKESRGYSDRSGPRNIEIGSVIHT